MALKLPRITVPKGLGKYAPPPVPTVKSTTTKTRASDYFTIPGETRVLYSAEGWIHARLLLQNAGPVAIGMDQNIVPVLSGKGRLLPTGEEIRFNMTKGDRIFIAAESINRVSFTIEPLPPIDRVANILDAIYSAVLSFLGRK